ncbi:MAG: hypothetical protein HQ521_21850 [Bacteroidetes bacterium]|nr:hypothetical protein [Bacteroidota bacterium]
MEETAIDVLDQKQKLPQYLIVPLTVALVFSIINLFFFATATLYLLYNPHFLQSIDLDLAHYSNLNEYFFVSTLLNLMIITCIILLSKLKKKGVYLFLIVTLLIIINELLFISQLTISYMVIGVLVGFVVLIINIKFNLS